MEYLKVNGTEYPAHFCGKQIDRDWDGRASKTVTLAMPYAQAVQLFVDGLRWVIVRREAGADDAAQEQDCSGYCVAGPITDNRDGTLSIKMGSYTQLEQALRELEEENGVSYAPPRREEDQVCLSAVAEGEVLDALRRCQTDALSPLEALNLIYEWKRKLSQ